jgi:hypothetical protein
VIRSSFKLTAEFFFYYVTVIWKNTDNLEASTTGDNFDKFKTGRAA